MMNRILPSHQSARRLLAGSRRFEIRSTAGRHSHRSIGATRLLSTPRAQSTATTTQDVETAAAVDPKPFTDIPGDWRSTFPILDAMPIFVPYLHKESGGMLVEQFMLDYYNNYGKEHGIARWGSKRARVALVFNEDYLQVFQNEGKYPSGILTGAWPIDEYNKKYVEGHPKNPFLMDGEPWRAGRMAINPYLFNIKEAQSYLPAINETVNNAVQHFEVYATQGRMDKFLELAAFDMFTAASLGLQVNSVGGDPEGLEIAESIVGSLSTMSNVAQACPYSRYDMLKFKAWDDFKSQWTTGREFSKKLMKMALEDGKGSGKGIMHGFLSDKDLKISNEEATEMYLMLTFAAADTTSSLTNNVLCNLAKNPDVQDKVRAEMKEQLGGKDYTPEGTKLPYFEQVLKETQRLTPTLGFTNVKSNIPRDLVMNGYLIPEGATVIFSNMGIANDEELAGPNPQTFDPDRFSEERIAARKGTRAEFLDHPLACKPFGFGARMCVGSRVAKLEYMSLVCRLIQDYEIAVDEEKSAPEAERLRVARATTIEYPCPVFKVSKV